jgi:hypothetical protein
MPSLRSLPCHQRPATDGAGPTATLPLGGEHDGKLGLLSGRSRQQAATGDRRESLPWHGKHLPYSVLCVSPTLTINRHRAQRAGPVTRSGMAHPAPQIAPRWLIDRRRSRRSSSRSMAFMWAHEQLAMLPACYASCLPGLIRQQSLIAAKTTGVRQAALPMAADRNHRLF